MMRRIWLLVLTILLASCQEPPAPALSGPAGPIYNGYLYLELQGELIIINIEAPERPYRVGQIQFAHSRWGQPAIIGNHLVATRYDLNTYGEEHFIFDLSSPASPQHAATIPGSGDQSLGLYGYQGLMLNREAATITLLDFSDPVQVEQQAMVTTAATGHIRVSDGFASAANMGWCGRSPCLASVDFFTWSTAGDLTFIHTVPLQGRINPQNFMIRETAFFYYEVEYLPDSYRQVVRVVDLARPVHDNKIAEHEVAGWPLFLSETRLLVRESSQENEFRLRLLDISNSLAFDELGEFMIPGWPMKAVLDAETLYIAYTVYTGTQEASGLALYVLDISEPTGPIVLANVPID